MFMSAWSAYQQKPDAEWGLLLVASSCLELLLITIENRECFCHNKSTENSLEM